MQLFIALKSRQSLYADQVGADLVPHTPFSGYGPAHNRCFFIFAQLTRFWVSLFGSSLVFHVLYGFSLVLKNVRLKYVHARKCSFSKNIFNV
jgi:hypothetical protein